jgi:hypothetical protein
MSANPNDPLLTVPEAARRMRVRERQVRKILARNLVQGVRTHLGICYRQDDVDAVASIKRR